MKTWFKHWWWAVLWGVLVVAASLGCAAPRPEVKKTTVDKDPAQVFTCAQESLLALGYTPENGSKDLGFIRGSKSIDDNTTLLGTRRLSDVITVAVLKNGQGSIVQVTAETKEEVPTGYNIATGQYQPGANQAAHTSDSAKADADRIQATCGGGAISPTKGGSQDDEDEGEGDEEEDGAADER